MGDPGAGGMGRIYMPGMGWRGYVMGMRQMRQRGNEGLCVHDDQG